MKNKIFTAIALLLVMIFCFSACSSQGESAYDIAKRNGFSGTEAEWLESLKGISGKNGENGKDALNLSIEELFNAYISENPNATFQNFLSSLSVSYSYGIETAAATGILSTLSVYSTFTAQISRPGQSSEYSSAGSGVVYKIDGEFAYIITNYHVIYDKDSTTTDGIAKSIHLLSYGYEYAKNAVLAQFVGGSINNDIALLKAQLSDFASDIKAATLTDSNDATVGETVFAVGNPSSEGISVSSGIISVDSEDIEMEALNSATDTVTLRVMRTDTPINSGNSGGGLFNSRGELVGIVNAKSTETNIENIGFAIPINVAAGIAESVLNNDSKKCTLGVTVAIATSKTYFNTLKSKVEIVESLTIESVTAQSLAYDKLLSGDVILSAQLNNDPVFNITRFFHLSDFLYKVRSSDTLKLEFLRNGEILTVTLIPTAASFSLI